MAMTHYRRLGILLAPTAALARRHHDWRHFDAWSAASWAAFPRAGLTLPAPDLAVLGRVAPPRYLIRLSELSFVRVRAGGHCERPWRRTRRLPLATG